MLLSAFTAVAMAAQDGNVVKPKVLASKSVPAALDESTAAVPAVSAPFSVMPVGFSMNYSHLVKDGNALVLGLAPYQTPLTWYNYTSGSYTSCAWTYPDPSDKSNMLTATTEHLEAPAYPFGQYAAPVLTVDGQKANAYAAVQYGGEVIAPVDGTNTIFEAALYNYPRYISGYMTFNVYGNGLSGVGETADAIWTSEDYGGGSGKISKVLGVGMVVPQPAAPYQTSYAYIRFTSSTLSDRSTLTCKVYSATSDMKLLAQGQTKKSQTYQTSSDSWRTALFSLKPVEGKSTEPLLVDGPVIIVFGGDMVAGENVEFGMARDIDGYDEGSSCRGYFVFEDFNGGKQLLRTNQIPFTDGSSATGLFASFDATYSWLKCDESEFVAPTTGGSKTFAVDAYYDLTDTKITKVSQTADWYSVDIAAIGDDGTYPLTVTADPLPEGTEGRTSTFTLNSKGLKKEFTVTQGSAAVATVAADSDKAYFSNGEIVLESATATTAEVYSMSGQKVAERQFTGKSTISAQRLERGFYVVKFANRNVKRIIVL